jgi:hypothetical protein
MINPHSPPLERDGGKKDRALKNGFKNECELSHDNNKIKNLYYGNAYRFGGRRAHKLLSDFIARLRPGLPLNRYGSKEVNNVEQYSTENGEAP